jgi:predicted permease
MNLRDFRIGWRLLAGEPGYSAAVILSLAVGFASCFLLLGFVRYSFSYDHDVPQAERVCMIKMRNNTFEQPVWTESVPLAFLEPARTSGMTDAVTAVVPLPVGMKTSGVPQSIQLAAVHADFPEMFGVRALAGDLRQALSRPDTLALTTSSATRLFGGANPVGRLVHIGGKPYTVAALVADRPSNSTLSYDALAGMNTGAWDDAERKVLMASWGYINGARIYVRLKPGVDADALRRHLQQATDNSPFRREQAAELADKLGERKVRDMALGALPAMYFDADTANTPNSGPHGDLRAMLGLTAVALLILALAAINYANLATVRALRRQREIAVRKVLGADGTRVLGQFLAESLLVAMTATALGLVLAWVLLPLFADLVDRRLDGMFTPAALLLNLALGAVIGLLAGAYPAWVALRVRPPQALAGRGNAETSGALWLRRALTVLQFSTAMGLVAVTLAVAWQTRYASQASPGFDPSPLLVLELPADTSNPAARGLREALKHLPGVDGVATSLDPVGRQFAGAYIKVSLKTGRWSSLSIRSVSADFFDVHALRPIAGRLFSDKIDKDEGGFESVLLNARAARALGFADPADAIGQLLTTDSGDGMVTATIVGIAPDLRYDSLRDTPKSYLYFTSQQNSTLTVRARGDMGQLESAARALAARYFPNDVVPIRQARSYFAQNYGDDLRLAKLLGLASAIAVMIAGFGVYVLSAYNVRRLGRQIVLRKLFGAGRRDIARLVGREVLVLVAISAGIGLPLAALVIQRYLSTFAEHAPIGGWTLLAGLLAAVVVTLVSTFRGTIAAAGISPALVLRN